MLTITDIQWAFQIAVFAVVFSDILTRKGMVFEQYGGWLERLELTRPKLAHPLGYCCKCFSGQVALWSFPIISGVGIFSGFFRWIFFVSTTIFLASLLSMVHSRLSR